MFCVMFYIYNHLFVFFLLVPKFIDTYVPVSIDVLITLLIPLSSASFYTSIL